METHELETSQCEFCNLVYLEVDWINYRKINICSQGCFKRFQKLRKSLFWIIKQNILTGGRIQWINQLVNS
jgi:hypothetical protein